MPSSNLKGQREKLEMRKKKMTQVFLDLEAQEDQSLVGLQQHKNFMDPKFTTVRSYTQLKPETEERNNPSKPAHHDLVDAIFNNENEKKRPSIISNQKGSQNSKRASISRIKSPAKQLNPNISNVPTSSSQGSPWRTTDASRESTAVSLSVASTAASFSTETSRSRSPRGSAFKGIMKPRLSTMFREKGVKVRVDGDSDSFSDEEFSHVVAALKNLSDLDYIFMQRLLDYDEIEAAGVSFHEDTVDLAYQIMTLQGNLIFLMEQHKIKCSTFIVYTKRCFENTLYDISGTKVLKFLGPTIFLSRMISKMTITDAHGRQLGYVKAFGTKSNYSIYNASGERLFLVVSNVFIPAHNTTFTILCRGQKIGVIKYAWKHTFHDLPYIDYETAGVEFPPELDEREKALLMGCMMLIEFSWYSPVTKMRLSMMILGLILLLFGFTLTTIPLLVDKQLDSSQTKSYYSADKI